MGSSGRVLAMMTVGGKIGTTSIDGGGRLLVAQQAASPAETKKHDTSRRQYQPSLDAMKDVLVDQPGAKPGDPAALAEEYAKASDLHFAAGCRHGALRKGDCKASTTGYHQGTGFEVPRLHHLRLAGRHANWGTRPSFRDGRRPHGAEPQRAVQPLDRLKEIDQTWKVIVPVEKRRRRR